MSSVIVVVVTGDELILMANDVSLMIVSKKTKVVIMAFMVVNIKFNIMLFSMSLANNVPEFVSV